MLCSQRLTTPIGPMFAVANDRGLVLCEFHDRPMLPLQLKRVERICGGRPEAAPHPLLEQTQQELNEYFLGVREAFTVPLVLDGTPFQSSVWRQLLSIPFGRTTSYDDIAIRLARPGGARAVGRANGLNRIAIVIPCHRVVNKSGELGGYGGGLWRKRRLLHLELSRVPF